MTSPLVIGYGNTLRSDDGAGVRAAELVRERLTNVDVITVHELQPEIVDALAAHRHVIFVDAGVTGNALTCCRVDTTGVPSTLASHMLTPAQLLSLCEGLYGTSPQEAVLIEIPASSFEFGQTFSPPTEAAIEQSVIIIASMLDTWRKEPTGD